MPAIVAIALAVIPAGVSWSAKSAIPSRELAMARHIGWEVDRVTRASVCVVASGHECLSKRPSHEAGGFEYPSSVAIDPRTGNLYVADLDNYRLQEFTATGAFIAMFGWEVNETEDTRAGAAQTEKDVCTAASGDRCKAGVPGTRAGQLFYPMSVTVDRLTGDVYVLDNGIGVRVEKYTATGRFVWTIGKGVNGRTKAGICTEREVLRSNVRCMAGTPNAGQSLDPGAFKSVQQAGDLLAAGGPEDLLYVGDEHRVQEFDSRGRWKREILLASLSAEQNAGVAALALEGDGELDVVYRVPSLGLYPAPEIVRNFNRHGEQVGQFAVYPRNPEATVHVDGIATDPTGLMAVIGVEIAANSHQRFGSLYDPHTGRLLGEFVPPNDNDGLTFDGKGDLYVAATDDHEVVSYAPAPFCSHELQLAEPCYHLAP